MKFPDLEKIFKEQMEKAQNAQITQNAEVKTRSRKKPSYAPKEEGPGFMDMFKLIPKTLFISYVIYTIIKFLT